MLTAKPNCSFCFWAEYSKPFFGGNPNKNVWKSVPGPVGREYGFTVGNQGYTMSVGNGAFEAYVFSIKGD